jgi:hypothetical protein
MEVRSTYKYARISPFKAREVTREIQGLPVSAAHLHYLEILHSDSFVAHMTRHSHIFPNTSRSRTIAHRTNAPMRFRTVRRSLAVKVVLLHHTLKSFSLRSSNHIDIVTRLKLRNAQIDFAFRKIIGQAKFAHEFLRANASLFEFAKQRFGHAGFLLHAKSDLHTRIAVVLFGQTT